MINIIAHHHPNMKIKSNYDSACVKCGTKVMSYAVIYDYVYYLCAYSYGVLTYCSKGTVKWPYAYSTFTFHLFMEKKKLMLFPWYGADNAYFNGMKNQRPNHLEYRESMRKRERNDDKRRLNCFWTKLERKRASGRKYRERVRKI